MYYDLYTKKTENGISIQTIPAFMAALFSIKISILIQRIVVCIYQHYMEVCKLCKQKHDYKLDIQIINISLNGFQALSIKSCQYRCIHTNDCNIKMHI